MKNLDLALPAMGVVLGLLHAKILDGSLSLSLETAPMSHVSGLSPPSHGLQDASVERSAVRAALFRGRGGAPRDPKGNGNGKGEMQGQGSAIKTHPTPDEAATASHDKAGRVPNINNRTSSAATAKLLRGRQRDDSAARTLVTGQKDDEPPISTKRVLPCSVYQFNNFKMTPQLNQEFVKHRLDDVQGRSVYYSRDGNWMAFFCSSFNKWRLAPTAYDQALKQGECWSVATGGEGMRLADIRTWYELSSDGWTQSDVSVLQSTGNENEWVLPDGAKCI